MTTALTDDSEPGRLANAKALDAIWGLSPDS